MLYTQPVSITDAFELTGTACSNKLLLIRNKLAYFYRTHILNLAYRPLILDAAQLYHFISEYSILYRNRLHCLA